MPKSRNRKRDKRKKHYDKLRKINLEKYEAQKKRDIFRQSLLIEHMKKAFGNQEEKPTVIDEMKPFTKEDIEYLGNNPIEAEKR